MEQAILDSHRSNRTPVSAATKAASPDKSVAA
jgi:hypothetical protein